MTVFSGCGGGGGGQTIQGTGTTGLTGSSSTSGTTGTGTTTGTSSTSGTTSGNTSATPIASLAVNPTTATLGTGKSLILSASAYDANKVLVPIDVTRYSWSVDNPSVVALTSTNDTASIIAGNAAGTATVTVTDSLTKLTATCVITVTATSVTTSATLFYNSDTNFNAGKVGPEWSAVALSAASNGTTTPYVSMAPNAPKAGDNWEQSFLGPLASATETLSLKAIPTHTQIIVTYDLFEIGSMDGNDVAFNAAVYDFSFDGAAHQDLLHTTFSNIISSTFVGYDYPANYYQSYPGTYDPANPPAYPAQTLAAYRQVLGYTHNGVSLDSIYNMTNTINDSNAAVKLNFTMNENSPTYDESWGVNNVKVYYK